jgi:hypothetical protein
VCLLSVFAWFVSTFVSWIKNSVFSVQVCDREGNSRIYCRYREEINTWLCYGLCNDLVSGDGKTFKHNISWQKYW